MGMSTLFAQNCQDLKTFTIGGWGTLGMAEMQVVIEIRILPEHFQMD